MRIISSKKNSDPNTVNELSAILDSNTLPHNVFVFNFNHHLGRNKIIKPSFPLFFFIPCVFKRKHNIIQQEVHFLKC